MPDFSRLRRAAELLRETDRSTPIFAAEAWVLAPIAEVALATLGVRRTLEAVDAIPRGRARRAPLGVVEARPWVARAFHLHALLPGLCLARSVVQLALHRRQGVPARLVIGVRRAPGAAAAPGLDAHAWVEPIDGDGSVGPERDRYATLFVTEATAP